jgi:hypothetical protein
MMAGLTKIEDFLIELGVSYEEIGPSTWLVEDIEKGLPKIVVSLADPVVLIRADVMKAPAERREAFFAELLKLNSDDLLHGAYALDGDEVVLVDTLEYAGMDKSEFQASLDAMGFALAEHYPLLAPFKQN